MDKMNITKDTDLNPDYFATLSDAELLTLAATAFDKVYHDSVSIDGHLFYRCLTNADGSIDKGPRPMFRPPEFFSPLDSNEDALRLSYRLRLDIQYDDWLECPSGFGVEVHAWNYAYEIPDGKDMICISPWSYGKFVNDEYKDMMSVRRAIVRTAAWVGALKLQQKDIK